MAPMPTNVLLLKAEGNTHTKNGNYPAAIECYNEALKRTKSEADAIILLLNRCHARLQSQHYDAAFEDAVAAIELSPENPPEKALFRAARALYSLQRWEESLKYLVELVSQYPGNGAVCQEIARCKRRLQEQSGKYEFKDMLEEALAKDPLPEMDRANFIGPIEVRDCEIKSHGRGMFTTKAVEAGDLLLCEKAFATVFPISKQQHELSKGSSSGSLEGYPDDENVHDSTGPRKRMAEKAFVKLSRNPSLRPAFADLYPGPDWVDEVDEETGQVVLDDSSVTWRANYNSFAFPKYSHKSHWVIGHHPESASIDLTDSCGIWIKASYINHSCYPMVRRSFIGDMMIFRAQRNIPADTELKFGYVAGVERYEERQRRLQVYGFECNCQICDAEKHTSGKKRKKRSKLSIEIIGLFEKGAVNSLQTYNDLLDALEATYTNPPSKEYRRAMIQPITNLITGCLGSDMPLQVIDLVHRLLRALGFELEITEISFKILQWGFLLDEVMITLVDLRDAYKDVNPLLAKDAEKEAKLGYLILCGEDVSWDDAYGPGGKRARGEGLPGAEGLIEGVNGLKTC